MKNAVIILCFCLFSSCFNSSNELNKSLDVSIKNLEFIYEAEVESLNLHDLKKEYGYFWEVYSNNILNFPNDSTFLDSLESFQKNSDYNEVYQSLKSVFSDMTSVENNLRSSIQNYNYYFPTKIVPSVITFYGGFNYPIAATDSVIGIGLEMFLGKNYDHYKKLQHKYPIYMHQQFQKEYISSVALKGWLQLEFPSPNNSFLSQMIHAGRIQYILSKILPNNNDSIIMGYSESQIQWCENNEMSIWNFFIEEDLLYSTKYEDIVKYLNPAPYSKGMPQDSPGQVAVWVGWQIVKAYMNRFPNSSLQDLMTINDAQYLLKKSKYKP